MAGAPAYFQLSVFSRSRLYQLAEQAQLQMAPGGQCRDLHALGELPQQRTTRSGAVVHQGHRRLACRAAFLCRKRFRVRLAAHVHGLFEGTIRGGSRRRRSHGECSRADVLSVFAGFRPHNSRGWILVDPAQRMVGTRPVGWSRRQVLYPGGVDAVCRLGDFTQTRTRIGNRCGIGVLRSRNSVDATDPVLLPVGLPVHDLPMADVFARQPRRAAPEHGQKQHPATRYFGFCGV